jgi:CHASE1-domain containing sensor protein
MVASSPSINKHSVLTTPRHNNSESAIAEALIQSLGWRINIPILLICVIFTMVSLAISVCLFFHYREIENRHIQQVLYSTSVLHRENLERTVGGAIREVVMLQAYISTLSDVTYHNFMQFMNATQSRKMWPIKAMQWIPRVYAQDIPQFEEMVRSNGGVYSDYFVKQRDSSGVWYNVSGRSEYYPVMWMDPAEENLRVIGFDLGSEPLERTTVHSAMITRKPAASAKVRIISENDAIAGFLILSPLYTSSGYQGSALGLFRLDQLVLSAIEELHDITVAVFDRNMSETDVDSFIFSTLDNTDLKGSEINSLMLLSKFQIYHDLPVANRVYRFQFIAGKSFIRRNRLPTKWIALFLPYVGALLLYIPLVFILKGFQYSWVSNSIQKAQISSMIDSQKKMYNIGEKLSYAEQKFEDFLNVIPDAIAMVNSSSGKIIQSNTSLLKLFHLEQTDLGDTKLSTLLKQTIPNDVSTLHGQEIIIRDKYGKEIPLHITVAEIKESIIDIEDGQQLIKDLKLIMLRELTNEKLVLEQEQQRINCLEQILQFDTMFHNTELRTNFKKYCEDQYSKEIDFLEAVLYYKQSSEKERMNIQHTIVEQFIQILTRNPILDFKEQLSKISKRIGQLDMFNDLEIGIKKIMFTTYSSFQLDQIENNNTIRKRKYLDANDNNILI